MLAFALCLIFALSAFTVGTAAALPDGYDGYTEIADEAGLRALMGSEDAQVLAGKYVLTADIVLGTDAQSPIGSEANPFTGEFDGNGKKISGISLTGDTNIGFFGVTKGAVIKNLTLEGSVTATGANAGGFIGKVLFPLTMDACINRVNVKGGSFAGGFIGITAAQEGETMKVTDCVNYGTVTAEGASASRAGGFIGVLQIAPKGSGVSDTTVEISGFVNAKCAAVTAPTMAGGFAGRIECGSAHITGAITVKNCENYADVSGGEGGLIGGIFGLADNNSPTEKTLSGLYNAGTVTSGGMYTGGIVGYLRVYNAGTASMTFADCANAGTIVDSNGKDYAAGLFGTSHAQPGEILMERLYNAGDVRSSGSNIGAISGKYNAATVPADCYYLAGLQVKDETATEVTLASTAEENAKLFPALSQSSAWKVEKDGPRLAALHECRSDGTSNVCAICGAAIDGTGDGGDKGKFSFTRDYTDNFTDVPANAWFYTYVRDAYRIGLANGTSATKFSPDGSFTVAQALTAAANIHTIYNGKKVDTAGAKNWYDPYVNYCIANGIITADQFKDYNAAITRGDMAIVFANILPDSEYAAVREGSNPDVTSDLACYAAVQKLYKAGIVGGDAGTGNYRPNDGIKRSEACVIFTRIAMADMRAK